MLIRAETPADHAAIHALTEAAFAPMPFSDGTEPAIVDALRRDGDLTISLVAEDAGEVIGHIAFSPVTIDGNHGAWFGLGPISVRADRQRQGIGKALIRRGLEMLEGQGAAGCALIGDPAVYSRAGFVSDGRLRYQNLDTRLVQHIVISGPPPAGILKFAPAFGE